MANGNGNGWKSRLVEWLLQQGVATVLLFALIGSAVWLARWAVPSAAVEFKTWHDEQEKRHRTERESSTAATKELTTTVKELTRTVRDATREISKH